MESKIELLEGTFEKIIEDTRKLSLVVSNFQPTGQLVLNQTINQLVGSLRDIDSQKSHFAETHIPHEVFDYIDAGKNPQLFTKDCIEKALNKNEQIKGKIELYKKFRTELLSQLQSVFPEEITEYKQLRGEN